MGSILKDFAKDVVKETKKNETRIQMIHYHEIKEADKNRELRDIEGMAEDLLADGIEHNLLVRPIKDNDVYNYELVAGHRRFAAINMLIDQGHKEFKYVPCKIEEMDDLDAARRKILNNLQTDPYTPAEYLSCIEELRHVFNERKKQGIELKGRIRELIAEEVGLKSSQVGVYEKVINNAIPEVRKKIEEGELTISAAAELSSLDDEEQLMFIEENDDLSLKTIKEHKQSQDKEIVPVSGTIDDEVIADDSEEYEEAVTAEEDIEFLDYDEEDDILVADEDEVMNKDIEQDQEELYLNLINDERYLKNTIESLEQSLSKMIDIVEKADKATLQEQDLSGIESACVEILNRISNL